MNGNTHAYGGFYSGEIKSESSRSFRERIPGMVLRLLGGILLGIALGVAAADMSYAAQADSGWRLRVKEAAVVSGPQVLLGEIADPVGEIAKDTWAKLAQSRLWDSPPAGKPMNMTRPRIQQAMAAFAGELSSLCIYPASMTIQQGGALVTETDLRSYVVKTLTPLLGTLSGEGSFQDFRLPGHVFLSHAGQQVEFEEMPKLAPGRVAFRFVVKELDGAVLRRMNGSVLLDVWADVPCAGVAFNRDDVLTPEKVSFARKNLAHMKDAPWDGRGGPWRVTRPLGVGQPILQADIAVVYTVKKGDPVTLRYEGKSVTVSLPGEAMSDASAGDNIVVRNLQSKKQVRGVVRDSQTVIVR